MLETLEAQVIKALLAQGWSAADGSAIAFKDYPTIVGVKRAHVFLAGLRSSSSCVVLQGDYWSEGRNVLEPRGMLIDKNATSFELKRKVEEFCVEADKTVRDSYAARLLRFSAVGTG